jgi:O-antigen/teichoic acid export membrane protein
MSTSSEPSIDIDLVAAGGAGGRAVAGGLMRVAGYLTGVALIGGASILLLHHLGVVNFGRYATVMAMLAIVSGLSELGLTVVGQAKYVLYDTQEQRRTLVADVLGIRLAVLPVGVLLAAGFGLVAGYGRTLVVGTLVAGVGTVIVNAAITLTLPLMATLRYGAATACDLARQAATAIGIAVLVVSDAGLSAFFTLQIVSGIVMLGVTTLVVGRATLVAPRFAVREWVALLREALPVSTTAVINVLYFRILIVLMSLLASAYATGLFATSSRVVELLISVPNLTVGAAFPILAHAGARDAPRLASAMKRLGETALLAGAAVALLLAIAAAPIVRLLGGAGYSGAAPVLRIQVLALAAAFMTQVWAFGLVSLRRYRALMFVSAVGLMAVLVLGGSLIPALGARGAALAAAVGETVLAFAALVMLIRASAELRPRFGYAGKVAAATGAAALVLLIPGLPAVIQACVAAFVYATVAYALGAIPSELLEIATARLRIGGRRQPRRGAKPPK